MLEKIPVLIILIGYTSTIKVNSKNYNETYVGQSIMTLGEMSIGKFCVFGSTLAYPKGASRVFLEGVSKFSLLSKLL
jgi:hypothetical protein